MSSFIKISFSPQSTHARPRCSFVSKYTGNVNFFSWLNFKIRWATRWKGEMSGKKTFKFYFFSFDRSETARTAAAILPINRSILHITMSFFLLPISSLCVQSVETGRKRKRTKTFWWWTLALYIRHCSFDIDFLGWKHAGSVVSSPIYREEECWRATFFLR